MKLLAKIPALNSEYKNESEYITDNNNVIC